MIKSIKKLLKSINNNSIKILIKSNTIKSITNFKRNNTFIESNKIKKFCVNLIISVKYSSCNIKIFLLLQIVSIISN